MPQVVKVTKVISAKLYLIYSGADTDRGFKINISFLLKNIGGLRCTGAAAKCTISQGGAPLWHHTLIQGGNDFLEKVFVTRSEVFTSRCCAMSSWRSRAATWT